MKKLLLSAALIITTIATPGFAAETPLCALPLLNSKASVEDSGCVQMLASAAKVIGKNSISLNNTTTIPPQLSVGAVYLQPITMAPAGMMRPREQSDIHLEMDIHAKQNLKSRGFAPGDWLPNAVVTYTVQKVGGLRSLVSEKNLMPMVASDGAHYGDNVKLDGPGFYIVTFNAHTNSNFGWHTDTESKILGTEFVNWQFKQSYLFAWTGIGKKGGY
jgi:periplasmic iron binding protein